MASTTGKIVAVAEVSKFIVRCMVAAGAPEPNANVLAEVLVTADYRGHFSHGLNRLGEGVDTGYVGIPNIPICTCLHVNGCSD